jgi:hypothetical protein
LNYVILYRTENLSLKAYELLVNLIEKKVEQATPREAAERFGLPIKLTVTV